MLNDSDNVHTNKPNPPSAQEVASLGSVNDIKIDEIEVNPFQPRTDFDEQALFELADSIKIQGLIQPITVRRVSAHRYQLISGERRLRASKLAGLIQIPAYVRTANDQQMLEMALIENIQRENAAAPDFHILPNKKIIFPKDAKAGGTWFAAADTGVIAVLLNGAFKKHIAQPPYRKSRGLILLEIMQGHFLIY